MLQPVLGNGWQSALCFWRGKTLKATTAAQQCFLLRMSRGRHPAFILKSYQMRGKLVLRSRQWWPVLSCPSQWRCSQQTGIALRARGCALPAALHGSSSASPLWSRADHLTGSAGRLLSQPSHRWGQIKYCWQCLRSMCMRKQSFSQCLLPQPFLYWDHCHVLFRGSLFPSRKDLKLHLKEGIFRSLSPSSWKKILVTLCCRKVLFTGLNGVQGKTS